MPRFPRSDSTADFKVARLRRELFHWMDERDVARWPPSSFPSTRRPYEFRFHPGIVRAQTLLNSTPRHSLLTTTHTHSPICSEAMGRHSSWLQKFSEQLTAPAEKDSRSAPASAMRGAPRSRLAALQLSPLSLLCFNCPPLAVPRPLWRKTNSHYRFLAGQPS